MGSFRRANPARPRNSTSSCSCRTPAANNIDPASGSAVFWVTSNFDVPAALKDAMYLCYECLSLPKRGPAAFRAEAVDVTPRPHGGQSRIDFTGASTENEWVTKPNRVTVRDARPAKSTW